MKIDRRVFQRTLLLGVAAQALPLETSLFASAAAWQDLAQPFVAQIHRLLTALATIGAPLPPAETASLNAVLGAPLASGTVARIEALLRPYVLLDIDINPESRVSVTRGAARAELVEGGWRRFLLRVNNQAHDTSVLQITSPQAGPMGRPSGNETVSVHDFTIGAVDALRAEARWLDIECWSKPPLQAALSGLGLEYRVLELYSRDHGSREASLEAVTAEGEQDLGFRSSVPILFQCLPAHPLTLRLREGDTSVLAASLLVRDSLGRIYPAQGKRALPDLWFQPQIYRMDGETLTLPVGSYTIEYGRGPEYLRGTLAVDVHGSSTTTLSLERWIHPADMGYFSGDSHIHAAGCSHYESPSEGVTPEVMLRQVAGEALDLGAVLTWAPGFVYQSQFFEGHVHQHHAANLGETPPAPRPNSPPPPPEPLLRYDLEVSGFPSSHCGHLVLLRLQHQNYPGTSLPDDWPSWNLPILKWAKSQGAVTGYAHSGHGMVVDNTLIPNQVMPRFDSCGANEYLVDITHPGMLDFISGCDLWPFTELNLWYHVLNCGFRLNFAGETDFPCITDACVGGGRTYVKLTRPPTLDEGYNSWLTKGLQHGKSYFGDGRSHLFNLTVEAPGATRDLDGLHSQGPTRLSITAQVCARLQPQPTAATEQIRKTSPYDRPFWHLERSRIGSSRTVSVELVVNGVSQQSLQIEADGALHDVRFFCDVSRSSWIALRIFPSSHTNPVPVLLGGQPIRASRRSAAWCRRAVDVLWAEKSPRIRQSEVLEAASAYTHARETYDRILAESS